MIGPHKRPIDGAVLGHQRLKKLILGSYGFHITGFTDTIVGEQIMRQMQLYCSSYTGVFEPCPHFDRIWEGEAPAEPLHFPQITDWLGRSLALPRE